MTYSKNIEKHTVVFSNDKNTDSSALVAHGYYPNRRLMPKDDCIYNYVMANSSLCKVKRAVLDDDGNLVTIDKINKVSIEDTDKKVCKLCLQIFNNLKK